MEAAIRRVHILGASATRTVHGPPSRPATWSRTSPGGSVSPASSFGTGTASSPARSMTSPPARACGSSTSRRGRRGRIALGNAGHPPCGPRRREVTGKGRHASHRVSLTRACHARAAWHGAASCARYRSRAVEWPLARRDSSRSHPVGSARVLSARRSGRRARRAGARRGHSRCGRRAGRRRGRSPRRAGAPAESTTGTSRPAARANAWSHQGAAGPPGYPQAGAGRGPWNSSAGSPHPPYSPRDRAPVRTPRTNEVAADARTAMWRRPAA